MAKPPKPSRTLLLKDRQKLRRLDRPALRRQTRRVLDSLWPGGSWEICFHFVGPEEMARVNWDFLGHEGSTDVITFDLTADIPGVAVAGEVFICVDDAIRQARRFRTTWDREVVRYVIHALLHLHGMDDHTDAGYRAMKREERKFLKMLESTPEPSRRK
jgi:probable rRNA maturation factor